MRPYHTQRLYAIWKGVRSRCNNPNRQSYERYGGRGITLCAEWDDYAQFAAWSLANGYAAGLELDRIDNDGPYSPENCRWVTPSANSRNRRSNHLLTAFGETKLMVEWVEDERCAVSYATLQLRINRYGWPPEQAIVTPSRTFVQSQRKRSTG